MLRSVRLCVSHMYAPSSKRYIYGCAGYRTLKGNPVLVSVVIRPPAVVESGVWGYNYSFVAYTYNPGTPCLTVSRTLII